MNYNSPLNNMNKTLLIYNSIDANGLKKPNNITVLSTLNTTDLEKKYGGDEKFTARLVDSAGNPCAQKTVHFHVNGVDYEKINKSKWNS